LDTIATRWLYRRLQHCAESLTVAVDHLDVAVDARQSAKAQGRGHKRWLKSALMIIISVGLLALTAALVGTQALLAGTTVLKWWTILAALGCGLLTTAAQAMRWKLLLNSRGTRLGWLQAIADCYSSSFLNIVLPGGLSGDLARVAVYRNT